MNTESLSILAVALVTWGGVFLYLVRLHLLARALDAKIEQMEAASPEAERAELQ